MARTKEIRFFETRTINTGNYESTKFEVGEILELERDDDPKKEMARLIKRVKQLAEAEAEEVRASIPKEKKVK